MGCGGRQGAGDKNCALGPSGFRTELIQAKEGLGGGRGGRLSRRGHRRGDEEQAG